MRHNLIYGILSTVVIAGILSGYLVGRHVGRIEGEIVGTAWSLYDLDYITVVRKDLKGCEYLMGTDKVSLSADGLRTVKEGIEGSGFALALPYEVPVWRPAVTTNRPVTGDSIQLTGKLPLSMVSPNN
jgi:hypothetical protein